MVMPAKRASDAAYFFTLQFVAEINDQKGTLLKNAAEGVASQKASYKRSKQKRSKPKDDPSTTRVRQIPLRGKDTALFCGFRFFRAAR